ncbi:MAG: amidohydrolase, partial [Chloroflexi bacterium]|nr:amidohydrolase [Chloroflexota bacterium]
AGDEIIDLGGRAVIPGMIDSHIHFLDYALSLGQVDLSGAMTLEAALERVAAQAVQLSPGEWIRGGGWDQNLWGGWPHRRELDRVAPDNPVALDRKDGHVLWANSAALRLAGIDGATPDPPGGEILRDHESQPSGILKERARELLYPHLPLLDAPSRQAALRRAIPLAHRLGLTGIHTLAGVDSEDDPAPLFDYGALLEEDALDLRVWVVLPARAWPEITALGLRSGLGDPRLRFGGIKIFADGTLGSQTADMLEPFEEQPRNRGIQVTPQDQLESLVREASRAGVACAVHCIGDRAVRRALGAFEKARRLEPNSARIRHRLEHAQIVHPQDMPRWASLGVIASMQPIHAVSDMSIADRYWGARSQHAYAWRSLLAAGARLAFGSDAPVENVNPLLGIHAAVTRQRVDGYPEGGWHPQERLGVSEAVYGYTLGAAYASGEEGLKGSLAPGKLADLAVLSADIFRISAAEIATTRVVMTVFDGRSVYRGEDMD